MDDICVSYGDALTEPISVRSAFFPYLRCFKALQDASAAYTAHGGRSCRPIWASRNFGVHDVFGRAPGSCREPGLVV